jgi:hypothetical protein
MATFVVNGSRLTRRHKNATRDKAATHAIREFAAARPQYAPR